MAQNQWSTGKSTLFFPSLNFPSLSTLNPGVPHPSVPLPRKPPISVQLEHAENSRVFSTLVPLFPAGHPSLPYTSLSILNPGSSSYPNVPLPRKPPILALQTLNIHKTMEFFLQPGALLPRKPPITAYTWKCLKLRSFSPTQSPLPSRSPIPALPKPEHTTIILPVMKNNGGIRLKLKLLEKICKKIK